MNPSRLRRFFAVALAAAFLLAPLAPLDLAAQGNSRSQNSRNDDGRDNNRGGSNGFDQRGFDRDGYDRDGYDRAGYDRDGCDRRGFDRRGRYHGGGKPGGGHRDKVTICHKAGGQKFNTLIVSENAVWAHLAHGDYLGPCTASPYK